MEKDILLNMYKTMYISRTFEETSVSLNKEKRIIGSIHAGEGEEAVGVGIGFAMEEGDVLAPSYRDISAMFARGVMVHELAGLLYGKQCGMSHGKTRILHVGDLKRSILPANPILGASSAIAVGAALAFKMQKEKRVVVNIMGDGASNEGAVHEAMNFASVKELPVIFVIVNNQYAWSTPTSKHSHESIIANRALAYGMEGVVVNGNDVLEVYDVFKRYIQQVREHHTPVVIEVRTYRWSGHSGNDKNVYRSDEERIWHYQQCPVRCLRNYILALGIQTEKEMDAWEQMLSKEVQEAYEYARNSEDPKPYDVLSPSAMLYMEGE